MRDSPQCVDYKAGGFFFNSVGNVSFVYLTCSFGRVLKPNFSSLLLRSCHQKLLQNFKPFISLNLMMLMMVWQAPALKA